MAKTLDGIKTFFKVSPVQQIAALGILTPTSIYAGYNALSEYSQGEFFKGTISTVASFACAFGTVVMEHKASKLMRGYKLAKIELKRKGWSEEGINPLSHSWCDRNVVQVASDNTGYGKETREYLEDNGYYRNPFSNKRIERYFKFLEFMENNKA